MNYYISTIAADAEKLARQHGLGLEIAEYCTAWNMDGKFGETDPAVRRKLEGVTGRRHYGCRLSEEKGCHPPGDRSEQM